MLCSQFHWGYHGFRCTLMHCDLTVSTTHQRTCPDLLNFSCDKRNSRGRWNALRIRKGGRLIRRVVSYARARKDTLFRVAPLQCALSCKKQQFCRLAHQRKRVRLRRTARLSSVIGTAQYWIDPPRARTRL